MIFYVLHFLGQLVLLLKKKERKGMLERIE